MQQNLFAYTEPGSFYPPYISLNKQDDGRLLLTIRGERIGDAQGPSATYELNPENALELGLALAAYASGL